MLLLFYLFLLLFIFMKRKDYCYFCRFLYNVCRYRSDSVTLCDAQLWLWIIHEYQCNHITREYGGIYFKYTVLYPESRCESHSDFDRLVDTVVHTFMDDWMCNHITKEYGGIHFKYTVLYPESSCESRSDFDRLVGTVAHNCFLAFIIIFFGPIALIQLFKVIAGKTKHKT